MPNYSQKLAFVLMFTTFIIVLNSLENTRNYISGITLIFFQRSLIKTEIN